MSEPTIEQTSFQRNVTHPLGRLSRQPSFAICVVLLIVCALGLQYTAAKLKIHFRKLPLELKKPLDDLDMSKLAPYEFVSSGRRIRPTLSASS